MIKVMETKVVKEGTKMKHGLSIDSLMNLEDSVNAALGMAKRGSITSAIKEIENAHDTYKQDSTEEPRMHYTSRVVIVNQGILL